MLIICHLVLAKVFHARINVSVNNNVLINQADAEAAVASDTVE